METQLINKSDDILRDHTWHAMQREAQLAAAQVAHGVTALGWANHAQTGLYTQAFFGLSIGFERMGKLIFVTDHAINNSGVFPTDVTGHHKLPLRGQEILRPCEMM